MFGCGSPEAENPLVDVHVRHWGRCAHLALTRVGVVRGDARRRHRLGRSAILDPLAQVGPDVWNGVSAIGLHLLPQVGEDVRSISASRPKTVLNQGIPAYG